MLGPLALLALAYGRKKSRGKWDMLVILLVLSLGVGMSLVACGGPTTTTVDTPTATATATVTPSPTGTATAAITVTPKAPVATHTPSPTVTMTCTLTPSPTPDLEPWKRYVDYDPISNTIPYEKWGALDSNDWDKTRVELILKWLDESGGGWWGRDLIKLTQWLLDHEGGMLLRETVGDNIYRDGGGQAGAKLMIRFMHRLFNDGRSDVLDLARFTCIFNADHTGAFTEEDWRQLHLPPSISAINTVNAFWSLEPLNDELTWWEPWESDKFPYKHYLTVKHPDGRGDILYFACKYTKDNKCS